MNRKAQMLSSHNTILGSFQVKHIYPEVSDQHNVLQKKKEKPERWNRKTGELPTSYHSAPPQAAGRKREPERMSDRRMDDAVKPTVLL